jgi:hypothetical protein
MESIMEYGNKRDYKKIDLFCKHEGKTGADQFLNSYVGSTTWARNLRVARERMAENLKVDPSRIVAIYA